MHPMKDTRAALQLKHRMTNVGFTDVESRLLVLPMCPWPAGTLVRKFDETGLTAEVPLRQMKEIVT